MRFHLNYTPPSAPFKINHLNKVLLIGSCFSENIGDLLKNHRFQTLSNPGGIFFNPLSISEFLTNCLSQKSPDSQFFIERDSKKFSLKHHSHIQADNFNELENKIVSEQKLCLKFLSECNYLFITFGTAFYYRHKALNSIVSNCHKQPAATFDKLMATAQEITSAYQQLITHVIKLNSDLKIIFTVSPVKHLKDGITENSLSKSNLLIAVNQLVSSNTSCFYFPAYELVNDDLRDYRFYKEDLAHPNQLAINYVWEKFSETYFSDATILLNQKINQLHLALNHKKMTDLASENEKHGKYIQKLEQEITNLMSA